MWTKGKKALKVFVIICFLPVFGDNPFAHFTSGRSQEIVTSPFCITGHAALCSHSQIENRYPTAIDSVRTGVFITCHLTACYAEK